MPVKARYLKTCKTLTDDRIFVIKYLSFQVFCLFLLNLWFYSGIDASSLLSLHSYDPKSGKKQKRNRTMNSVSYHDR